MHHRTKWTLAAALLIAPALPGDGAADAFRGLQETCRSSEATAMKKALPDELGERMVGSDSKAITRWREEFAALLSKAEFRGAREAKDDAVARCAGPKGGEIELPLRRTGGAWVLTSPVAYLVKGSALDETNGKTPAALRLAARTADTPYGESAFSFAHVTRNPAECANRMDLWYCHNGDLHVVGDGAIARVAAKDLAAVTEVPLGVAWDNTLAPAAGGIYVLRCQKDRHRDFLVKFRAVVANEKRVDLEWAILGAGFGSPSSIRKAQPLVTNDGADGFDRICTRNRERSEPAPEPKPPATSTPK